MVKVREIVKRIEDDGWYRVKAKGGHRQYKHPSKRGMAEDGDPIPKPRGAKAYSAFVKELDVAHYFLGHVQIDMSQFAETCRLVSWRAAGFIPAVKDGFSTGINPVARS